MSLVLGSNLGDWSESIAIAFEAKHRTRRTAYVLVCYLYMKNGNCRGDVREGGKGGEREDTDYLGETQASM